MNLIERLKKLEAEMTTDDPPWLFSNELVEAWPKLLAVAEAARQYRNCYLNDNEKITGRELDKALVALEEV